VEGEKLKAGERERGMKTGGDKEGASKRGGLVGEEYYNRRWEGECGNIAGTRVRSEGKWAILEREISTFQSEGGGELVRIYFPVRGGQENSRR